jgi:hypothetical protein
MKKQLLTIAILASSPLLFAHASRPATPVPYGVIQARAKAPLGDLSKFRIITVDTLQIAKSGDLKAAEKRITDMETAWDTSANKLQALDKVNWRKLDLALDHVLFELRADKPSTALCTKTLEDMLKVIDSLK